MSRENSTRYLYAGSDPTWSDLYEEARPRTKTARASEPVSFDRVWDAAKTCAATLAVVLPMAATAAFASVVPLADPTAAPTTSARAASSDHARMSLDEILDGIEAGRPPRLPPHMARLAAEAAAARFPTDLEKWSTALATDLAAADPFG